MLICSKKVDALAVPLPMQRTLRWIRRRTGADETTTARTGNATASTVRLLRRTGGVATSLALSQLCTGLIYILAARQFGPANFGRVATVLAVSTIGVGLFDLGLNGYVVREIAAGRVDLAQVLHVVRRKRNLLPLLGLPTYLITILVLDSSIAAACNTLLAFAMWEALTANSLMRAVNRFRIAVAAQVVARVSSCVLMIVIFALGSASVSAMIASIAVGWAAEAAANYVNLRARKYREEPLGSSFWTTQRKALSFGLTGLAGIGQQLDTPLVALGGGSLAAGLYAAAGRLLSPLIFLSSALNNVAVPWLAAARPTSGSRVGEERKILWLGLGLAAAPVAAGTLGPVVLPLILGSAFGISGEAVLYLSFGAGLSTMNQSCAIILQNRKREKWVAATIASGLLVGLATTYLFALLGGAVLAAWAFLLSQAIMFVLLSGRYLNLRRADRDYDGRGEP